MNSVIGKGGITVTVIKDSINENGNRLTTYEAEYPRIIHSELMTHCMLEKNAASSRAIPVENLLKMISESPAMPISWGANNPGMVSRTELEGTAKDAAIQLWISASQTAVAIARVMAYKNGINAHKQIANRICEPFSFIKTVITGTEWKNFFWLRNHPDADPTFQELAKTMWIAQEQSIPTLLKSNEWHLPYVDLCDGTYSANGKAVDIETALKVSASCCAQVSYRRLDDSIEKAIDIFDKLNIGSTEQPAHASPLTHQGRPMVHTIDNGCDWENGITHMRRNKTLWSGKFQGWIQHRQLIENEAQW
jgi:hypothetical protein